MGFWDVALKVAKNAGTAALTELDKSANEIRELRLKYEGMGDDELLRLVHSDGFFGKSQKEKGIAFSVLKSRGLSVEEINSRKS
jgi:hypothetical protein